MLELWRELHGPAGVAAQPGHGPVADAFASHYFFARALTLGGGTAEIQRNVLAERLLGLPRAGAAGRTSTSGPGPERKQVADE